MKLVRIDITITELKRGGSKGIWSFSGDSKDDLGMLNSAKGLFEGLIKESEKKILTNSLITYIKDVSETFGLNKPPTFFPLPSTHPISGSSVVRKTK